MPVKLNIPSNVKIVGANIVPTPTEAAGGAAAWKNLQVDWPWTTWIKPQIDYAVGNTVGCNCIRMIGDYMGVFAGTFTQSYYNANWAQLVSYCAGLGVYVYVTGGDGNQTAGMANSDIYGNVNSLLSALSSYRNIIGVDVIQELNGWSDGAPLTRAHAVYTGVKAGGTTLPLSFSCTYPLTGGSAQSYATSMSDAVDYWDWHVYGMSGYDHTNPLGSSDVDYYVNGYAGYENIIGEFGSPQSDTLAQNIGFFDNVMGIVAKRPSWRGALMWAIQDQDTVTSNEWGMYNASWAPRYAFQTAMRQVSGGYIAKRY